MLDKSGVSSKDASSDGRHGDWGRAVAESSGDRSASDIAADADEAKGNVKAPGVMVRVVSYSIEYQSPNAAGLSRSL